MQRLLAGLGIALGCHILVFMVPIQTDPVNRSRLPKSSGITVGFSRVMSKAPPEKDQFIPSPKPILPLKERAEKTAPPSPQQKATPKPRPTRKMIPPVASIPKPDPPSRKAEPPPVSAKKPTIVRRNPPVTPPPDDTLPDAPEFFPRTIPSSVGRELKRLPPAKTPIVIKKESDQISPRVSRAYPKTDGNPPPQYPILARRRGWQGTVQLTVRVLENGHVDNIAIEKSSGYPILDKAALNAVSRYRFVPGQKGGRPVAMRVRVPVHFRLQDAN